MLAPHATITALLTHLCACFFAQSPQEWQTGVGLPFVKIQGTTVEWGMHARSTRHACALLRTSLAAQTSCDSTFVFYSVFLMKASVACKLRCAGATATAWSAAASA
jgi:hypothetical protein